MDNKKKTIVVKRTRCNSCDGVGILKLDIPEICVRCNGNRCYRCDKKGSYKLYDECNICAGSGSLFYNVKTNKPIFTFENFSRTSRPANSILAPGKNSSVTLDSASREFEYKFLRLLTV